MVETLHLIDETSLRLIKNDILKYTLDAIDRFISTEEKSILINTIDDNNKTILVKLNPIDIDTTLKYIGKYALENELYELCAYVETLNNKTKLS